MNARTLFMLHKCVAKGLVLSQFGLPASIK
jgi:hypothetical protein